jgi:Flp pilus assembly protein TadG
MPTGWAPAASGPIRRYVRSSRGSVLLETAIAVPALLMVTVAMLWGIGMGVTSLTLSDSARDIARAIARGQNPDVAVQRAAENAPQAHFAIDSSDKSIAVKVSQFVSIPLPMFEGLGMRIEQAATAPREETFDALDQ